MSNKTILKVHFLNEWTPKDFTLIQKAIAKHFKGRFVSQSYGLRLTNGNFRHIDEVLGLAYTSSSSFALYGICNVELQYNNTEYNYQFFAISDDHKCYAILWDKDENEKIIKL
jgi:hypothetical protein